MIRERETGRPLGVVYTPPDVAGPMVRLVLEPLVRGKSADEILALRVCDPAIGAGAFLIDVVDVLAEHLAATGMELADAKRRVATTCIAGVDIDREAVAAARAATGCEALRVADALELDWPRAYPEVFARGGFDVVVGNPPYIRQEMLANKQPLRGFASYDGVADLYVYFIELAHRLARDGGRYCLIVPNKWMSAAYGRALRTFLAEQGSVDGVVDFSRVPVFAEADAFPCIVWGTRRSGNEAPIAAVRPAARVPIERALRSGIAHQRDRWSAGPWHIDAPEERELLDRLEREHRPLGDRMGKPSRGVVTGCNRAFVIDQETRDRIVSEEPAAAELIRPFLKGRDVRRWKPAPIERWIVLIDRGTSLAELPVVRAHLEQFRAVLQPRPPTWKAPWSGRKPGSYKWFELQDPVVPLAKSRAPRLLYQDIQTGPACCLDREGELVPDTTVWIVPSSDLVLLAVLNSRLYGWYAQRRFPPALNGAVRPKLDYMRAFPLVEPSIELRRRIEQLVERRLVGGRCDDAIDDLVAEAYALTAEERALVRGQDASETRSALCEPASAPRPTR